MKGVVGGGGGQQGDQVPTGGAGDRVAGDVCRLVGGDVLGVGDTGAGGIEHGATDFGGSNLTVSGQKHRAKKRGQY